MKLNKKANFSKENDRKTVINMKGPRHTRAIGLMKGEKTAGKIIGYWTNSGNGAIWSVTIWLYDYDGGGDFGPHYYMHGTAKDYKFGDAVETALENMVASGITGGVYNLADYFGHVALASNTRYAFIDKGYNWVELL